MNENNPAGTRWFPAGDLGPRGKKTDALSFGYFKERKTTALEKMGLES